MSSITYVGIDSNPAQVSIGDTLLTPLRFCGREWNAIRAPLEEGNILWKAAQVAWKAIASFGMIFATGLALLPALIGSILKASDAHTDIMQCDVDPLTRNRCLDLGVHDLNVREALVSGQICAHHNDPNNPLPGLFASLFVSRGTHSFGYGPHVPSTQLTFQVSHLGQFPFSNLVDHIINCFKIGSNEEIKTASLQRLSDVALGIERPPLNPLQPFEGVLVKNYSKVVLTFSNDLRKMEVKAFT